MITRRTALLAPAFAPALMSACADVPPSAEGQHPLQLEVHGTDSPVRLWLSLPRGYPASTGPWPLVVFLHGSGERGSDVERVKVNGPPKLAGEGVEFPFVLASPQLDEGRHWEPGSLHALLQALRARLRIDPDRVCATGLSLGGIGVWDWATAYPDDLAAIAPVCGYGDTDDACRARRVPVRAYHGADDPVVPIALEQASVDALRACGGKVDLIVYPGVGHNAWERAYADPALVPWLMAQRRRA
jgi:predicted peptidase